MAELTVLIATHNGAKLLPRVLEGYLALGDPGFAWKLVIVDNASNDDTQVVLAEYTAKLPLQVLSEATPGKNRALNCGLTEIEGETVILSDDDSIPHAGFLSAWRNTIARQSDAEIFGGSIVPLFDVLPPDWMLEERPHFAELYAERQNVSEGPISADWIFGPNMAVRTSLFRGGLRFDEGVGPDATRASNYAMGSETAFLRDAERAGKTLAFAPEPTVSHIVRANQITRDYIAGRAYRMGSGTARKQISAGEITSRNRPFLLALGGRFARSWVQFGLKMAASHGSPAKRFEASWEAAFRRGYRDELDVYKAELSRGDN